MGRRQAREAKIFLGDVGEVKRIAALSDVYETPDIAHEWNVASLDASGDGGIYVVTFNGPFSYERALEYAEAKYSGLLLRELAR